MSLPDTQAIDNAFLDDDQQQEEDNPNAWCRLTSISVNTDKAKPPVEIPETIIIDKDTFTIGRAGSNDLPIAHLGISGHHLEITRCDKDRICIMRDKSTNGTWINGIKMTRLQPQEVDFGSKVEVLRANEIRVAFTVGDVNAQHALLGGKYVIRRDLGSGAYADVKLAMDPNSGYQYAVKIIERAKLGVNSSAQDQLLEEVRILRQLKHHAVVNCHDYFSNDSRFYIVLDYMPAGDLLEYLIAKKIPFTEPEALDLFCQLTEAVHYLHQNNVVHRDIKPENILLDDRELIQIKKRERREHGSMDLSQTQSQQNPVKPDLATVSAFKLHRESTKERYLISNKLKLEYNEQPDLGISGLRIKLTDFGLSKSTAQRSSRLKTICGTPQYLAPEVLKHFNPASGNAQERSYGKEIDVWSLGAILFVMLTVSTPFNENNLMKDALVGKYEARRLESFSPEVKDIIKRMLTVDPQQRITTEEIFQHPWCAQAFAQRKASLERKQREAQTRQAHEANEMEGEIAQPQQQQQQSQQQQQQQQHSQQQSRSIKVPAPPSAAVKRSAHQAHLAQVPAPGEDENDNYQDEHSRGAHNKKQKLNASTGSSPSKKNPQHDDDQNVQLGHDNSGNHFN